MKCAEQHRHTQKDNRNVTENFKLQNIEHKMHSRGKPR